MANGELAVSMPELLAHTNMDQQSVNKLREHLDEFIRYLAKSHEQYFQSSYENGESLLPYLSPPMTNSDSHCHLASTKYIEQSKGV